MEYLELCCYPKEWKQAKGRKLGLKLIEQIASQLETRSIYPINDFNILWDRKIKHYRIFVSVSTVKNYCKINKLNYKSHSQFLCDWSDGFVNGNGAVV